ncbi:UTRA domain-containing protein, partial [Pandoraea sputorum]|uniref:UTRA domain-containing protein n=1 Tax=Pandoraea sputorum TaxID=93222 RepID=UPI0035578871
LQPASAVICQRLQLPALSSVIQICRARRIDQRLVLYVGHYLRPGCFPGILDCDLSQSLTELYTERYGLQYGRVNFELSPTALHAEAAAALKVSIGTPGLCIARVNHDRNGRLIDCDLEYWRHDAIRVSAVMGGG